MKPETVFPFNGIVTAIFFGTWIVLGIGGFLVFYLGRDAAFKRRWFPRFVMLAGLLFVFFSTTLLALSPRSFGGPGALVLLVPGVCLISWLNIKFTKFCEQCGSILFDQNWFSPMRYCPKCGASLDSKPRVDDDLLD
jgi:hypothetical protein